MLCHLHNESGKNLPDIAILTQICQDNKKDINELLKDKKEKPKHRFKKMFLLIFLLIILILCSILLFSKKENSHEFQFKAIKATCDNFELYGSIAYNDSKTSIYISNITYCGTENKIKYKEIECTLYESYEETKTKIESYKQNGEEIILEDFLKQIKFNVDHYSNTCKMLKKTDCY